MTVKRRAVDESDEESERRGLKRLCENDQGISRWDGVMVNME